MDRTARDCVQKSEQKSFPFNTWGGTVPKRQGLTLQKVVIIFGLVRQGRLYYGQMYVTLSRVTSLDSLYLICLFILLAVKPDPR